MDDEFLSAAQLEADYVLAESTWRYWASIGKGPKSVKLGRRRLWRRSDVEKWLHSQEAEQASATG